MNAFSHLLLGLFVAAVAAGLFVPNALFSFPLVSVACLGALAPDLDHRKTKLFKALLALVFGFTAAAVFPFFRESMGSLESAAASIGAGFAAAALVFLLKPRHRGFTHSAAALVLFAAGAYLLTGWEGALLGGSAYASHLLSDGVIKAF